MASIIKIGNSILFFIIINRMILKGAIKDRSDEFGFIVNYNGNNI